jgi:hypothetical protein
LDIGRLYARQGIPVSRLLRAHRLGHLSLLEQVQAEAPRLTGGRHMIHLATLRLVAIGFDTWTVPRKRSPPTRRNATSCCKRRLALTDRASKRIGTTLYGTRTAEELTVVCTEDFADLVTVDLFDSALDETGTGSPEALAPDRARPQGCSDRSPQSEDQPSRRRRAISPDVHPGHIS